MVRSIIVGMFLAGALGLRAQVSAPGLPSPDASVRTQHKLDPLVQIGGDLQQRTFPNPEAPTRSPWPQPQMSQTQHSFTMRDSLNPMRSFTIEPRSSTEYGVRSNSNPFENHTIRLQSWGGFTIQDNLSMKGRSYTVSPEPFGRFGVHIKSVIS